MTSVRSSTMTGSAIGILLGAAAMSSVASGRQGEAAQGWREEGRRARAALPGGVALDLVWIEPGSFVMGSRLSPERLHELFGDVAGDPEANRVDAVRRPVRLTRGLWLGAHEVTNRRQEK